MWYNYFYGTSGGGATIYIPTEQIEGVVNDNDVIRGILVNNVEVIGKVESEVDIIGKIESDEISEQITNNEIKGTTSCQ